jgi:effector-binding domain-containing protein
MPIDKPYRARFEAQTVARIHVVTPRQDMRSAMHAAIDEVSAAVATAGVSRTGPWFMHFHCRPTDTFDLDVCFPVSQPLQPSGRVTSADIPAAEVLRTVHHGTYEELPQAWQDFSDWVSASGFHTREDGFEVYTVGPNDSQDPAAWQTELNRPLADEHEQSNTQATH